MGKPKKDQTVEVLNVQQYIARALKVFRARFTADNGRKPTAEEEGEFTTLAMDQLQAYNDKALKARLEEKKAEMLKASLTKGLATGIIHGKPSKN